MTRKKTLSKKQLAVIDDLFSDQFDEQAVLDRHKVSGNIYNKWLADDAFTDEFNRRIAWLNRQSDALIARYAFVAAAKLVQLTESESQETARKACLDIISLPRAATKRQQQSDEVPTPPNTAVGQQLSTETASRLLAALAEERGNA